MTIQRKVIVSKHTYTPYNVDIFNGVFLGFGLSREYQTESSTTYCIVELEDGSIILVKPENMKFIDQNPAFSKTNSLSDVLDGMIKKT